MATAILAWSTRLLALTAALLAALLWWNSASTEPTLGCDTFGEAFDCDAVLASRWAKWFGVPVAAGGTLCYAIALMGSFLATTKPLGTTGWRLLEAASTLAVGSAIWFVAIQTTMLDSYCWYCVATHACGLAMASTALAWCLSCLPNLANHAAVGIAPIDHQAPTETNEAPPAFGPAALLGAVGLIALVGGQIATEPAPSTTAYEADLGETIELQSPATQVVASDPEPEASIEEPIPAVEPTKIESTPMRLANGSRWIGLLKGQLKLNTYDHAIIGSPEAPHVVVELMDYACRHCREFHEKLVKTIDRFDGQVAVIVMPIPGEITCNPYVTKARKTSIGACFAAKLSIAVAQLEPGKFEAFHHWMLQDDIIPRRTASLIEAREHVDGDQLSLALRDSDGSLATKLSRYVEIAGALARTGKFGLPTQIIGDQVLVGPPDSVDEICQTWADLLDLELPAEEIPF